MNGVARTLSRRLRDDERGTITILFVLALTVLLLMAALAIDLGNLSQNHQEAQDATDSAAVSGAGLVGSAAYSAGSLTEPTIVTDIEGDIIQNAPSYNGMTAGSPLWNTCTTSLPAGWVWPNDAANNVQNCIAFNASGANANELQVAIPPEFVKSAFGEVGGITGQLLSTVSFAEVPPSSGTAPCGLCSLGPASLQNGNLTVSGGAVWVDGGLTCNPRGSITDTGNLTVNNAAINIAANGVACNKGTFSPTPNWNAVTNPDPLAGLPAAPNYGGLTAQPNCSGGTANPGIYNNIGSCTLNPGLYVVTGVFGGNGSTTIIGSGVTIFFTCGTTSAPVACSSSGQAGGAIETGGNGTLNLSACTAAPCPGGATAGMTIWYDRHDTSTLTFHGNGSLSISGTIYAKSADIDIEGTPAGVSGICGVSTNLCSEVVVSSFSFSGQGTISVAYNQSQNVKASEGVPELCSRIAGNC